MEADSEIALAIYNLNAALRELRSQVNDITIERGALADIQDGAPSRVSGIPRRLPVACQGREARPSGMDVGVLPRRLSRHGH